MRPDVQSYEHSLALLRECLSPAGFLASSTQIENYARVWARDGVITGLAALASGDPALIAGMRRTLLTLTRHQGSHGEIPSNVSIDGAHVSFGRLVGRVDALLWYIIGACAYIRITNDVAFKQQVQPAIERALFLAGGWEFNERGLLYTPLAGNWADEYLQQGYVLSDQLLYTMALEAAGTLFTREEWLTKAALLRQMLVVNYWPQAARNTDPHVYHPAAYQALTREGVEPVHWLPAFSPAGYQRYFDGLAHALALLADLGTDEQRQRTVDYVETLEQQTGSKLLPAFWPVIQPGTDAWQQLEVNHLYGQLKNQPYKYHNGGLWPVLTGLYATGIARHGQRERAASLLQALNEANEQGRDGERWEFAEYHHARTFEPLGTKHVAWSGASAVLAYQSIWNEKTPLSIERP